MIFTLIAVSAQVSSANEYITIFRDAATGTSKFHVLHTEIAAEGRKAVELNVKDKKAWLIEDPEGNVTLIIGEEAFTAPKAKDKEPITSISYFSKVYANVAAPKPKKNLLGSLGGGLLGAMTGGLGGPLLGSALSGSLGSMSNQVLASAAVSTMQGLAVREMTQSLGRATSYSAMTEGDDPMLVRETTKVDKTTLAETLYLRKREMSPTTVPTPASPKSITAAEIFEKFTQFMSSGADDEKKDESGK